MPKIKYMYLKLKLLLKTDIIFFKTNKMILTSYTYMQQLRKPDANTDKEELYFETKHLKT